MGTLQFFNGQLLFRGGKLAMDARCCCGAACVDASEVIAFPGNRALFSFLSGTHVASANPAVFLVNGATGTIISIIDHNVLIQFGGPVASGDPWSITDGSQITFDDGSTACTYVTVRPTASTGFTGGSAHWRHEQVNLPLG